MTYPKEMQVPIKIEEKDERLKIFESMSFNKKGKPYYIAFCGGSVTALDWCPLPNNSILFVFFLIFSFSHFLNSGGEQLDYLAVSCLNKPSEEKAIYSSYQDEKNAIHIWSIDTLSGFETKQKQKQKKNKKKKKKKNGKQTISC